jgi:hypothetical protein
MHSSNHSFIINHIKEHIIHKTPFLPWFTPPGYIHKDLFSYFSFSIKIVLLHVHYIRSYVRLTSVAPSSTTCDMTLNYISTLNPSELHISQQNIDFDPDSKRCSKSILYTIIIHILAPLVASYILYLYYKMS